LASVAADFNGAAMPGVDGGFGACEGVGIIDNKLSAEDLG